MIDNDLDVYRREVREAPAKLAAWIRVYYSNLAIETAIGMLDAGLMDYSKQECCLLGLVYGGGWDSYYRAMVLPGAKEAEYDYLRIHRDMTTVRGIFTAECDRRSSMRRYTLWRAAFDRLPPYASRYLRGATRQTTELQTEPSGRQQESVSR